VGEGEEDEGEGGDIESAVTFSKNKKGDKFEKQQHDLKKRSSVPAMEVEEDYSHLIGDVAENGQTLQEVRKGHKPSLSWIDETHNKIIAEQKVSEESRMSNYRGGDLSLWYRLHI
jgi:glucose-6-phosphate 1-dehydrogenase